MEIDWERRELAGELARVRGELACAVDAAARETYLRAQMDDLREELTAARAFRTRIQGLDLVGSIIVGVKPLGPEHAREWPNAMLDRIVSQLAYDYVAAMDASDCSGHDGAARALADDKLALLRLGLGLPQPK